ncbi:MAG: hypothetical protein JWN02_1868, partial [Acidobacteria bacterium]|nr:hypothetical protein [Acidobacteriota bacterium]
MIRRLLQFTLLLSLFRLSAQAQIPLEVGAPMSAGEYSLERTPLPLNDRIPEVTKGGPGFLVTWQEWLGSFEQGSFAALLGPSAEATEPVAFPLATRSSPAKTAWNGEEFLITYGLKQSRFNTFPTANLGLRRYSASGAPIAEEVQLGYSQCNNPVAQSVLWSKGVWFVAWSSCGTSFVTTLDRSLHPLSGPRVMDGDTLRLFEGPDGESYLLRSGAGGTAVARIAADLTRTGEQSTTQRFSDPSQLVTRGRLYLAQSLQSSVSTAVYDFSGGWSVSSTATIGPVALYDDGNGVEMLVAPAHTLSRLQLHGDATTSLIGEISLGALFIDSMAVASDGGGRLIYALSSSPSGDLPLGGADIDSAPLSSLSTDSILNGQLLSARWTGGQSAPSAVATASGFLLLWDQYVPTVKTTRTFALGLDANGTKLGPARELPFLASNEGTTPGRARSVVWNGRRVLAVWNDPQQTVHGVWLDAVGQPDSPPFTIGSGIDPVAASNGPDTLVLWEEPRSQRIRGTPVGANGSAVPGGFTILENGTTQWNPALVWNGTHFIGAWFQPWDQFHLLAPTVELTVAGTALRTGLAGDLILTHSGSGDRQLDNLQLRRLGDTLVAAWSANELNEDPLYLSALDL